MRLIRGASVELLLTLFLSFVAILINDILYGEAFSIGTAMHWMVRYFTFGNAFFVWFFLFIYLLFFGKFYVKLSHITSKYLLERLPPAPHERKELVRDLVYPLYLLAPIAIVTGPLWTLLGNMSYHLRFTQWDEVFLRADVALFHRYPFLWLPNAFPDDRIVSLLQWSYISLSLVMSVNLIILYLLQKTQLFRQAILAFVLSLALAFPFFYAFPCQDPANYFLRNLRGYPLSSDTQQAIAAYHPSPKTEDILMSIASAETKIENDNTVPISCFPSMHAVWGMFVVYFLFLVSPLSFLLTLPWLLLLLTGGVYFAQHYVVDYIIALPVAAASLFLANLLLRFEAWRQSKNA